MIEHFCDIVSSKFHVNCKHFCDKSAIKIRPISNRIKNHDTKFTAHNLFRWRHETSAVHWVRSFCLRNFSFVMLCIIITWIVKVEVWFRLSPRFIDFPRKFDESYDITHLQRCPTVRESHTLPIVARGFRLKIIILIINSFAQRETSTQHTCFHGVCRLAICLQWHFSVWIKFSPVLAKANCLSGSWIACRVKNFERQTENHNWSWATERSLSN